MRVFRHVLWMAALAAASTTTHAVPSFEAVRAAHQPSDVPLLDRHGATLQLVRIDPRVRRGPWVALGDVSPALRTAIVLGEDRRFWEHGGVDWRALAASAWITAWNSRTRGASTLTMQLAGLSDEALARPAGGRSVVAKITQIHRAQQFEDSWTKSQILEAYLNRVPLRGELVGVEAAAQQLFGKHASGLDHIEAAVLSALVRAPNATPEVVERRACELLRLQKMGCESLAITWEQARARRPAALLSATQETLALHLGARVGAAAAAQLARGVSVRALPTTLDAGVQRVALASLRRQLAELKGREVEDGAVVVLDRASGDVLAWVGSSGSLSNAAEVDAVLARRQPGSTLKPFVYALALQRRLLTAGSLLDDSPLQLAAGAGLYQPQNYDHQYKGYVPVRAALAGSLNVPAVRVASMLGTDDLFDGLQRAGLRLTENAGFHGLAMALGGPDVTLLDLANAYRMLANGGRWSAVRWQPGAGITTPPRQALDPGATWIVSDMLADPAARAATFGLDSALVTRGWAAVKTGTSKDLRDNWCVGSSSRYTVGVWVGNASGAAMHGVSGVSGAAPVWRELMLHLHAQSPSMPPAALPGLKRVDGEWYLAGTEPRVAKRAAAATAAAFGISSPRDGTIVLLDPEIPMAAQRLVLQGAAGRWFIDGQEVGRGTQLQWLPRPGRHRLERRPLLTQRGEGVDVGDAGDSVQFEVRAQMPAERSPGRPPRPESKAQRNPA